MPTYVSNRFKLELANGKVDWDAASQFKAILCYNTFDGTEDDDNVGDITTLGEVTGTGYAPGYGGSGRKAVVASLTLDEGTDSLAMKIVDLVWSAIDVGGTECAGVLIYMHGIDTTAGTVTSDANAPVVAWLEFAVAKRTNGEDLTVNFNQTTGAIALS